MTPLQELKSRRVGYIIREVFAGTLGGVELILEIDASTNSVWWIVKEGDHETYFSTDFDKAAEFYINVGGTV